MPTISLFKSIETKHNVYRSEDYEKVFSNPYEKTH